MGHLNMNSFYTNRKKNNEISTDVSKIAFAELKKNKPNTSRVVKRTGGYIRYSNGEEIRAPINCYHTNKKEY